MTFDWKRLSLILLFIAGSLWIYAQTETVMELPVADTTITEEGIPGKYVGEDYCVDKVASEEAPAVTQSAVMEDAADIHELQELVVQSRRAVVEGNKIVVVPTKSEKKLSNSPASLIDQMQFPGLKVKDGQITGLDGQPVVIYINGVAATEIDYETFWPKNAVRVEYILNPTDQGLDGASRVLNFIVTEPEVGGVTKLNGYQKFPNYGQYDATSKLTYKAMSYGFRFSGRYSRDHSSRTEGEDTFYDLNYDGEWYERISRTYKSTEVNRQNSINTAFNARYYTQKMTVLHTIGLLWTQNPGTSSDASQIWTPSLFDAFAAYNSSSARSLTPQASGWYRYSFNPSWSLVGSWRYSHTRSDKESIYCQAGMTPLSNKSKETTNALTVSLEPRVGKNGKWVVSLPVSVESNWFDTHYAGTADTNQKMTRQIVTTSLSGIWAVTPKLTLQLQPGISVSHTAVADISETQLTPNVNAYVYWMPTSRLWMNAYVLYEGVSPASSEMNPVTTQITDLMWQTGNPYLKNKDFWSLGWSGGYVVSNSCEITLNLNHVREINDIIRTYTHCNSSMGGLLTTYDNAPLCASFSISPEVSIRVLHNKLRLNLRPRFNSDRFSSETAYYKSNCRLYAEGNMTGYLGNFSLSASFTAPWKYYSEGGTTKVTQQSTVNVWATFGTGDLYVDVSVHDIFHRRRKVTSDYHGMYYSNTSVSSEIGRSLTLSLSYFFGYGKKVDRSIDIEAVSAGPTSVL